MRSLREWIAAAPTAALAAALAVVVIGAGLFGFAIAGDRGEAVRLARNARSRGAQVRIVRFGGSWLVLGQKSQ